LPYHPEEISELYLGAVLTDAERREILAPAKALNPRDRGLSGKAGQGRAD
jgi:hypothetical protein